MLIVTLLIQIMQLLGDVGLPRLQVLNVFVYFIRLPFFSKNVYNYLLLQILRL